MWTLLLWVVFLVSVLVLAFVARLWHQVVLMRHRKQAGTEYLVAAFAPVIIALPVLLAAGAWSAVALGRRTTHQGFGRDTWYVAGGVLALLSAIDLCVLLVGVVDSLRKARARSRRVMSQKEMLDLVRSGGIKDFSLKGGQVWVGYRAKAGFPRAHRADPDGYVLYVAAANRANQAAEDYELITYFNHDSRL